MTFPIRHIDQSRATQYEPVGSKPKVWLDNDVLLFKGEVRGTGADWAEVVAARLCRLLGLPHVDYELAKMATGDTVLQRGVICANMAPGDKELVLGNQLLLDIDKTYPSRQRWKVRQHTVDAVCHALEVPLRPAAEWTTDSPEFVFDALGFFIGYVMLDAWIANQDRHHENWGLIWDPAVGELRLAPTFDHGAGMACILTDEKRQRHLTTRDRNDTVEAFCARAKSGFYADAADRSTLTALEAFLRFSAKAPVEAKPWVERLRAVTADTVWGILEEVPDDLMTSVCRDFTWRLLTINRERILAAVPIP